MKLLERRGFTLVELLVVIAIIGILVALLLPAVQAAREAARRTQCTNNFKQMAVGLHNYHDQSRRFPFGSRQGTITYRNLTGSNWRTAILPFVEQQQVYDKLNFSNGSFSGWNSFPFSGGNEILKGLLITMYKCPSSKLDPFVNAPGTVNDQQSLMHDYVGISGACPDPGGRANVCKQSLRGWVTAGGLLVANEVRGVHSATDGTSTTIMIAEQSAMVNNVDIRSNYGGGWCGAMGANVNTTVASMPASDNFYHCGLATVFYAINTQTATAGFSSQPYETNTILNSYHPGAIQVALADGSVRTIADSIDINLLKALSMADDGQPVGSF